MKDAAGPRLQPDSWLVLDLSALTFCDSTGLGAFVALHRQATSVGATFALAGPGKRIADLFALSGIDQVVPVLPTRDEALTARSLAGSDAPTGPHRLVRALRGRCRSGGVREAGSRRAPVRSITDRQDVS